MYRRAYYHEIREQIKDGDVIAFGGKGQLSGIIKLFTLSTVSHVGVVMRSKVISEGILITTNEIIESTTLDGFSGVTINKLSKRLKDYDGEAWWLPLNNNLRLQADMKVFYQWLKEQNRKCYDTEQAIGSAFDILWNNKEDFDRFFCSELVAAALEKAGVIKNINASEVLPRDLCKFKIYDQDYYQLSGETKEIRGFNSLDPEGFGI